jgi:predicted PurR-regulated permease PerM
MTGYGFGQWIAFAVVLGLVLYPVGRILRRMGFSPLLSIVVLIPFLNLLALWIVAFVEWPRSR